jgi:hypothetical protein
VYLRGKEGGIVGGSKHEGSGGKKEGKEGRRLKGEGK